MVSKCVYCGEEYRLGESRTYHKFPLKDAQHLDRWLKNIGLRSSFIVSKFSDLCSDHFEKNCFQKDTNKACLLPGSVPTIFGRYKSACVFCHVAKGQNKTRSFRKFPLDKAELLQKWITAMNLKDFVPDKKSLLCSDHFEKACFRKTGRLSCNLSLKDNAVPTIFTKPLTKETPAREHNIDAKPPVLPLETFFSSESSVKISTSDVHMVPHEKQLATHERREKRGLFENLPAAKIHKSDSIFHTTIHPVRESISDSDERGCNVNEVPSAKSSNEAANTLTRSETMQTPSIRYYITHDHQYESTPRSLKRKVILQKKKIQALVQERRANKQKILRLKKQVTSLKETVNELRKTQALPGSGIECLTTIANTDVPQFLTRFIVNQKHMKKRN